MMKLFSLEFLVAVLFIIDLFFFFLIFLVVRRVNRLISAARSRESEPGSEGSGTFADAAQVAAAGAAETAAGDVKARLIPLIEASGDAAEEFDRLIREKKKISRQLNDALDDKIISINLLLSRASALEKKLETSRQSLPASGGFIPPERGNTVLDQQSRIIEMYYRNVDIDTIAEQLSIPKGEVQLVIDLKEKCTAMEKAR
ncbi:MAG: hypothetical protein HUN04_08745 [Desulfobacter sp.]|nr:MAG: hypothetical protein HUN04_08745 [Desulfobacter sp.]